MAINRITNATGGDVSPSPGIFTAWTEDTKAEVLAVGYVADLVNDGTLTVGDNIYVSYGTVIIYNDQGDQTGFTNLGEVIGVVNSSFGIDETSQYRGNGGFNTISVLTNGTAPVDVFPTGTLVPAMTITNVTTTAQDVNAANILLINGANTVTTIAKSTTAGALVGTGVLSNATVAAGASLVVESSAANGNAIVTITYQTV